MIRRIWNGLVKGVRQLTSNRWVALVAGSAFAVAGGCVSWGGAQSIRKTGIDGALTTVGGQSIMGYGVLDLIFGLTMLCAAASVIAAGFGLRVPPKTTVALVLTAIGAAVLKIFLVKFLWIVVLLAFIAAGLTGFIFGLPWLERKFNRDINNDGQIG